MTNIERPAQRLGIFGPRHSPKPGDRQDECAACHELFYAGDFTTFIKLGPGADPEQQRRCREGLPYDAVALEVHWACATGIVFVIGKGKDDGS